MQFENNLEEVILAVDIGTTNLKCFLFKKNLEIINSSSAKIETLKPFKDCKEWDSNDLLNNLRKCLLSVLDIEQKFKIKCFGISTLRNSFIIWNRNTNEKYTNFILWNDKRNKDICKKINNGFMFNSLKNSASLITKFVTNHRIKSVANFKVEIYLCLPKLKTELDVLESRLDKKEFNEVSFGSIETWLVWAISKEKLFVSDVTCSCSTGIFDMFYDCWSPVILNLFGLPKSMLPKILDTCDNYGHISSEFLNLDYNIPINSVIGDTPASFIAECGFNIGDCVITVGTGSFISINIGNNPISSDFDNKPQCAFKYKDKKISILQAFVSTAGPIIDWAKSIGLFENYDEIDEILNRAPGCNEIFFIPNLIEIPDVDGTKVGSGFIGLNNETTKAEMLKAIFNSLALLIKIRMDYMLKDLSNYNIKLNSIRLCGGVTKSKYFCQFLTNLLNNSTEISNFSYSSSAYGAAFLAGLQANMYEKLEDLNSYREVKIIFNPETDQIKINNNYECLIKSFKKAIYSFSNWNNNF